MFSKFYEKPIHYLNLKPRGVSRPLRPPPPRKTTTAKTAACITLNITYGDLKHFQKNIQPRIIKKKTICGHFDEKNNPRKGYKTISPIISPVHLFIELLNWNGNLKLYIVLTLVI